MSDETNLFVCIAGLRFVTTFLFIFLVGVFVSLWIGVSMLLIGEWFIKRMPLVKHIHSASKQISDAISPGAYILSTSFKWIIKSFCLRLLWSFFVIQSGFAPSGSWDVECNNCQ